MALWADVSVLFICVVLQFDAASEPNVVVFDASGEAVGFTTSDATGAYTVRGLPTGVPLTVCVDGAHAAGASATGYSSQCGSGDAWDVVDAPPSSTSTITTTLGGVTTDDVALTAAGAVAGQLTDATGAPTVGVRVEVVSSAADATGAPLVRAATTDNSGSYTVPGLPAGPYRVCVDATRTADATSPGSANSCTDADVALGSSTQVAAALDQAGGLRGTATSGTQPLTDVIVAAVAADGSIAATARTAADGTYRLGTLPAGTYSLCWSGARSVDPSAPAGYTSGCLGATGAWDGGAAVAGSSSLTVAAGQYTSADATLSPASGPGAPTSVTAGPPVPAPTHFALQLSYDTTRRLQYALSRR